MKKAIVLVFAFVMSAVLYAGENNDFFDVFYKGMKKAEDSTLMTQKDLQHRTIFVNVKVEADYADVIGSLSSAKTKRNLMSPIRNDPAVAESVRKDNFSIIYNFVTKDYKVYSIIIHSSEF